MPPASRASSHGGELAIIDRRWGGPPALNESLMPIFQRFTFGPYYRPFDPLTRSPRHRR